MQDWCNTPLPLAVKTDGSVMKFRSLTGSKIPIMLLKNGWIQKTSIMVQTWPAI